MRVERQFHAAVAYVAISFVLWGCGNDSPKSAQSTTPSSAELFLKSMVVAKDKMTEVLKDPASAQYRQAVAYPFVTNDGTTLYIVCGQVNAKNGFGAYMGFRRFIATPEGAAIDGGTDDFQTGWIQHCNGPSQDAGF